MNKTDMTIATADSITNIREFNAEKLLELTGNFTCEGTNEQVDMAIDMHQRLVRHELLSIQHAYVKREFDKSKKGLDTSLITMGIVPDGIAGGTKTLYEDSELSFHKRQNVDGTTTLLTDVLIHLARLGVDKDKIDQAMKLSTKPKKGNTYYIIEIDD